ncbi:MAG: hypothetical protein MJ095_03160 [Oscillospiraceae bacterium]|nr:hypothetical protein [Oscillospiraceae bacterium]
MFPAKCKAILKLMNNEVLEYGFASYSAQDQYLDFTAQFVPILQINSEVKVVCSENGVTTHVFTGSVYLSSSKLLRVIDLKCAFIHGAEKVLAAHVPFNAQVFVPAFRKNFLMNKLIYRWENCSIKSISMNVAALECPDIIGEYDDKIIIKISDPIFSKPTEIHLHTGEKGLMFGNHTKYKYKIGKINKRCESELGAFIRKANMALLGDVEMIDEQSLF